MMEENKTVFNYIGRVFAIYGIVVLVFIVLTGVIGDITKGYSPLFELGGDGISLPVLCELLLLAVMITITQFVFLTDKMIMIMSMLVRNVLFFLTIMIVMVIMILAFKWFTIDDLTAWIGFVVSYAVSMIVSALITKLKEKTENIKMQEALDKYNKKIED